MYVKFSPSTYAQDFKTPTLVMDGELDFRHSSSQALQLFTTLQQQNVPSKLVLFPDEGYCDPEAAKQLALVSHRPRLDRRVDQEIVHFTAISSSSTQY